MGKRGIKCFLGFHGYEVYSELDIVGPSGNPIRKIIILKCADCGNIKSVTIDIDNEKYFTKTI